MKTKFDFTEGKWKTIEEARLINIKPEINASYNDGSTPSICTVWKHENAFPNIYNGKANANLIVCAPEMLMALIRLIKGYCYHCPDSDLIKTPNENQCHGCRNYNYIKIVEKATGKKWEEINEK